MSADEANDASFSIRMSSNRQEPFNFCIDFQNRGCVRQNCRFIHAAEELVSEYMTTREVTLPLARCIVAVSTGNTIAGIPLCGEFQDGICTRTGCRYWHINADEERTRRATQPVARVSDHTVNGYGVGVKRPIDLLENSPYAKMSRLNDYGMTAHPSHVMDLERSNAELRKEVDMLRFQLRNERERYQDLYSLFRQLVGFGTVRLQAPQPPHPGQLPQTAGATPSESFPPVGGYKPPPPAPEWQGQTPSKW